MKKRFSIMILCLLLAAALGGCALFPSRLHGVERLLVVQALGVDRVSGALRLSMVSAADSARGEGPIRLCGSGLTLAEATENIDSLATEEELFCAHTGHVLIGEATARQGVGDVLRFVCRSRELRMDVPLYLVRGGSAAQALLRTGDARIGAVEELDTLAASAPRREGQKPPSVARIAGTLEDGGCALAAALRLTPSSEQGEDETPLTLAPAGCGVIADGKLVAFIEEEDMPGLDFLTGAQGVHTLVVRDREGQRVTLRTAPGRTRLRPLRDAQGELTGLELSVSLDASVAEIDGPDALSDADYSDALAAAAEREVLRLAGRVLQQEKSLGADFLDLGGRLALASSAAERARDGALRDRLGTLELRLAAEVAIIHSNDVRDG